MPINTDPSSLIDPSNPMNLQPPIGSGAPVGVTGTSATAFQVTGQAVKDSVSPSGGQSAVTIALDPKKPNLAAPDLSKLTDAKLADAKNFIVENPVRTGFCSNLFCSHV